LKEQTGNPGGISVGVGTDNEHLTREGLRIMMLEEGKYYKSRDGYIVGPVRLRLPVERYTTFPFTSQLGITYTNNGVVYRTHETGDDLVSTWDPVVALAAQAAPVAPVAPVSDSCAITGIPWVDWFNLQSDTDRRVIAIEALAELLSQATILVRTVGDTDEVESLCWDSGGESLSIPL